MEACTAQLRHRARLGLGLAQSSIGPSCSGRTFCAVQTVPARSYSSAALPEQKLADMHSLQVKSEVLRFFNRTNAMLVNSFPTLKGTVPRQQQQQPPQQQQQLEWARGSSTGYSMYVDAFTHTLAESGDIPRYHGDSEGVCFAAVEAMDAVERSLQHKPLSKQDEYEKRKWNQQLQSEIRSAEEAMRKYKFVKDSAVERGDITSLPNGKRLLSQWYKPLLSAIKLEQEQWEEANTNSAKRAMARPDHHSHFLLKVKPEKLAVITMHALTSELISKTGSALLSKASMAVGRAVQLQYNMDTMQAELSGRNKTARTRRKKMMAAQECLLNIMDLLRMDTANAKLAFETADVKGEYKVAKMSIEPGKMRARQMRIASRSHAMAEELTWPTTSVAKLGSALVACLLQTAMVEVPEDPSRPGGPMRQEPAFRHSVEWSNPMNNRPQHYIRRYGVISAHPEVFNSLLKGASIRDITVSRYFPMVVPPLPWVAHDTGGHLTLRCLVMRTRGDRNQRHLLRQTDREMANGGAGMRGVYEALTALGSVGWKVNKEILQVVEKAWAQGGAIADLPIRESLPLPPRPPDRFRLVCEDGQMLCKFAGPSFHEERAYKQEAAKVKKKNYERHSLKCDMEYKLQVARETKDEPVIYFPHNVDFRGRAYPMHPYLSHLGPDVCRALLQFSEARPLGEKGLDWLFIQAANLYGANKMSLEDRRQYIVERLDKVRDSARNPMAGEQWWAEADEPWQCLAVCMDIVRAIDSGDPASYMSHLPVHQDGSCNGLQHYAALGRDAKGARAVNITDVDKPQDVYSGIAELVAEQVMKDAEEGMVPAKLLVGNVDRKLVKQTVMTSVYGVTFIGAREQIANRLRERGWEDDRLVYQASKYGAKVTMTKLHEMFVSAKNIMNWLGSCARAVAAKGHSVEWVTPLGLPVVQPYRRTGTKVVKTVLQRMAVRVHQEDDLPVMKQRQKSAFPPNYIHSIDSTHMMMTAIECRNRGLSFAGVHDSFWTHAGTIHVMNEVLREKFLELHSRPLLEELHTQLTERFPDAEIPDVPEQGDLKLEEIHKAKYFFS
mmetsp:Transcript_38411/g.108557  ORF Transcript_38411/g.108557 Transcript_38411/m.108557 type:complete len:1063 (+) Transcript_38411:418-3606(+)